jgi:hypothetical protein
MVNQNTDPTPVTVPSVEDWTPEQYAAAVDAAHEDQDELYIRTSSVPTTRILTGASKSQGERPGVDALAGVATEVADEHDVEVGRAHIDDAYRALGTVPLTDQIKRAIRNSPKPVAPNTPPPVPRKK